MTTLACSVPQKSLRKKFIIQRKERKNMYKYREELAGEKWFTTPDYNTLSATNILYMTTLTYRVPQKSLTKNCIIQMPSYGKYGSMQRKKNQIQRRINKRRLLAMQQYNPSLSTCIPNMTTLACTVSQKSLTKNFIIQSMKMKIGRYREESAGEGWFVIP